MKISGDNYSEFKIKQMCISKKKC